ncbi:MAG: aminoacyl-histidine dipeptidase [Calditrichaceae bacterium]|nr:aminoacyl-histidine dipeptidase [Calditrichaceae bacterium]HES59352.1 aminoacyl-histidine dipeptidase [Caldithrix sp.]
MSSEILNLKPGLVWKYFYELNQIPRCSGHEEAAGQFVISVAEKFKLKWKKDPVGNVLVSKPASNGMENRPAVVIQGHLDMVCEKNKDTIHDFSKDPIKMLIKDGWVTADGTTLGSDNGIAVAMGLAIMEDDSIVHPPMEFLFTVDEETGLTGAVELKSDFVDGRVLLNIDSEEEGALYIGCAGGQHTILNKKIDWTHRHDDHKTFLLKVSGLRGGHSGLNIHEGFGNAIKLLSRILFGLKDKFHYHLVKIEGGSKHNAIPREAEAIIDVPADSVDTLKKSAAEFEQIFKDELRFVDAGIEVTVEAQASPKQVFSTDFRDQLIGVLYAMPHGVIAMSHAIEGLVETSTNMAIIETKDDIIHMLTSQRSSVASSVVDIADKIKALGQLGGFDIEQGGGYPAWEPNPDSKLLKVCKDIYKNKYGNEPHVKAIHAGLECGIIGEKYDGMDMISFGPDIQGAHSPDERIKIDSVEHVWEYLLEILREIK